MGYEVKLIIGVATNQVGDEFEVDTTKPYPDLSGFERKRDARGNNIKTGRKQQWFHVYAEIGLSKIQYEGPLSKLISATEMRAKEVGKTHVVYFYGTGDGDTEIKEDRYSTPLIAIPARKVLVALEAEGNPYRRIGWAAAFLKAMGNDIEDFSVIFYGH